MIVLLTFHEILIILRLVSKDTLSELKAMYRKHLEFERDQNFVRGSKIWTYINYPSNQY